MILPDRSNHERAVTIRSALPGDRHALELLAELDSRRLPDGPLLLAEVAGSPWAAVSLDGSAAIANPFKPSGDLVELLRERARQLHGAREPRRLRRLRTVTA
jgi:hypothetical protein